MTEIRDTVILVRAARDYGGHLHSTRRLETTGPGGPRAWRTAFDDTPGGELSRLAGGHPGAELIENMKKQAERFGAQLPVGGNWDRVRAGGRIRFKRGTLQRARFGRAR